MYRRLPAAPSRQGRRSSKQCRGNDRQETRFKAVRDAKAIKSGKNKYTCSSTANDQSGPSSPIKGPTGKTSGMFVKNAAIGQLKGRGDKNRVPLAIRNR